MQTRKAILVGLVLVLAGSARATEIAVDLGPRNNNVRDELITSFSSADFALDGRTLSIDFTFTNAEFIHMYSSTSKSFGMIAVLPIFGSGTIATPTGFGYTVGADGLQNSPTSQYGTGGSITANGAFGMYVGYGIPLSQVDIFGMHIEITMPDDANFSITGEGKLEFHTANPPSRPWNSQFAVGPHVPDSGGTGWMFIGGLGIMIGLRNKL